jgi:glutamate synthase (ferredoxin)
MIAKRHPKTPEPSPYARLRERFVKHPGRGGCGVGAVADLEGPSRTVVEWSIAGLGCMEHRGGSLEETGDGAGLLLHTPREFFLPHLAPGRHLRDSDHLSVAVFFFPPGEETNLRPLQQQIDAVVRRRGLAPLGWRRVPVNDAALGVVARRSHKEVWQLLIGEGMVPRAHLPLALFKTKSALEHAFRDLYVVSMSAGTVAYKALATGEQLAAFFPDLADPTFVTDACVFHRRYSTNTFSNWYLAQPFRLIAHNGEINTIKAVRSAVQELEAELGLPGLLMHQGSDSADLDRMAELLHAHGVPLAEALMRILPAAWRDRPGTPPEVARWQDAVCRAMGSLAAWEGPAAVLATDGDQVVGILDRMGLRPLRWVITKSRKVILASEVGAVPVDHDDVAETGQLEPGEAMAVDLRRQEILRPDALAERMVAGSRLNVSDLATDRLRPLPKAAEAEGDEPPGPADPRHLVLYGWSSDRMRAVQGMAREGKEPLSSMGNDRPLAVFSPSRPNLTKYFRQIIAVVTNPPIDPIREGGAMDLSVYLGRAPMVSEDMPDYRIFPQYRLSSPFLDHAQMAEIDAQDEGHPRRLRLDATYRVPEDGDAKALAERIRKLVVRVGRMARRKEAEILVVTDRRAAKGVDAGKEPSRLPVPMLLLVSAIHEALTEAGMRRRVSIVVESAEVQEGHDAAVLIANGADAVHPWLFLEVCANTPRVTGGTPIANGVKSLETSLARILSKMGITTLEGYRASRLFEAVGVSPALVDHYLPGVTARVGGIELEDLHEDCVMRGRAAADPELKHVPKPGEAAIYRKDVWHELQLAARGEDPEAYGRFLKIVDDTPPVYLRDLLDFEYPVDDPLHSEGSAIGEEEVAPPEWIIATTFRAAAMSHGALHRVAHRAIAAAFNRFGARSNSGEGGEDVRRDRGGPWQADRSRIRQIASGRFGVEARYLVNADEIEIKIGQGAKPGEGGHLPGEKITAEIAAIRKTRPGVALISPPPHHDIYSIEDLAQLVYNLRQISPKATIGVKIPTVTDIGTIAVGVVKAGADVVSISGAEGGTGAAAASSIEHAGLPLERGLAEVHQALVINGIREGVVLRADGGIKTGEDVVKIIALGADEVSLGTALMIAEQCVFCHGCAKGNCPAGITTQSEDVAQRLMKPKGAKAQARPVMALAVIEDPSSDEDQRYLEAREGVARYLLALANDVRGHLARLGLRSPAELVGRVDLLRQVPSRDPRCDRVDLSEILVDPYGFEGRTAVAVRPSAGSARPGGPVRRSGSGLPGDRVAPSEANRRLLERVGERLAEAEAGARIGTLSVEMPVRACDRAVGATLAGEAAAGRLEIPAGGITLKLKGDAGQALGFGWIDGLTLDLEGYGNDAVGEAMSGGTIIVRRPPSVPRDREEVEASAVGNAVGYGMTGGHLFVEGRCGQRLGVRCSGGLIVCEGAGKYAFEYMTGGVGVVLGPLGGQACSGMTGGVVYLYEADADLKDRVNADARLETPTDEDLAELRDLVSKHQAATGSPLASRLLEDWANHATRFRKAVPAQ